MKLKKYVTINCVNYDAAEWSKWEIIAHELKLNYSGKVSFNDVSVLGLGQFLELSDKIITRQLRAMKRKKKK